MQGAWWELKVKLDGEEYAKLKASANRAGKDLGEFVHEILRRFLETSSAADED